MTLSMPLKRYCIINGSVAPDVHVLSCRAVFVLKFMLLNSIDTDALCLKMMKFNFSIQSPRFSFWAPIFKSELLSLAS